MPSPCEIICRWAEGPDTETGFTWWNQIGRLKSDVHTRVQRTKCFIEYKSGVEAEDSFQIGLATNKLTGLDVELLNNRTSGELEAKWGRQTSEPSEICICAPVKRQWGVHTSKDFLGTTETLNLPKDYRYHHSFDASKFCKATHCRYI